MVWFQKEKEVRWSNISMISNTKGDRNDKE